MSTKLATKLIADYRTVLTTEIAIGGTSGSVQTATDSDGVAIPTGTYYLTLDGNGTQKEHIVCTFTAGALTSIQSVSRQGALSAGCARKHRVGASVEMTDWATLLFMNNLFRGIDRLDASTPLEYDGSATISLPNQLATKAYADGLAIAGAPASSNVTAGILKKAAAAQMQAGTDNDGTYFYGVPVGMTVVTSGGAGDFGKLPRLGAAGTLHQSFYDQAQTWATVQTISADNLQISSDANSANDAVRSSYLDSKLSAEIPKGGVIGTAGEAITVGTSPIGLYIRLSDGLILRTNASVDESTYKFIGLALTPASGSGQPITFAPPGHVVSGLTGLTPGANYYLSNSVGALSTTPGTRHAKVGRAISATQMLVLEPKFTASGSFTGNRDSANLDVTIGFRAARILFFGNSPSAGILAMGCDDGNGVAIYGGSGGILTGLQVPCPGTSVSISVIARTETNFTVDFGSTDTTTCTFYYIAFSE